MQERRRASARSSKSNRKGIRVQPRFFIFAGILLGIIAAVIVLIATAQHTVPVEEGTIGFSMSGTGIVIRKETLYQTENYGKSVFIAKEGQHVSSGAVIADVYTWDYSDSIVSQLKNLENKIMDYQLTSLESQGIPEELSTYNKKIQQMSSASQSQSGYSTSTTKSSYEPINEWVDKAKTYSMIMIAVSILQIIFGILGFIMGGKSDNAMLFVGLGGLLLVGAAALVIYPLVVNEKDYDVAQALMELVLSMMECFIIRNLVLKKKRKRMSFLKIIT